MNHLLSASAISDRAKHLFREEREMGQLTGWFTVKQIQKRHEAETKHLPPMEAAAVALRHVAHELPISLSDHAIFAGTQRDAFASSYALINPAFQVETFAGYCDPTEVFDYIKPTDNISAEEIAEIREYVRTSPYGKALSETYAAVENDTAEVAYFIEQVTGHVIPDLRRFLANGLEPAIAEARNKAAAAESEALHSNYRAMAISLEAVLVLAERYRVLALEKAATASGEQRAVWESMAATLQKVPAKGADTLYEAIQSFLLLWQAICVEQAPNPFAMSVGNADRIFEPYRAKENLSREDTAALLKHLLVFYNVGDRSWAISQNLIIGGKLPDGSDLTNPTSYALLDAYYDMMLPQPILSVKLHNGTPEKLYEEMGRFFFTPGQLTPSLFNDESVFQVLQKAGVQPEDLADYSIAGCQEPLIMGQDNGNTTNSWLNLAKILELTLNEGVSSITGKRIGTYAAPAASPLELLQTVRQRFAVNLEAYADRMVAAANNASRAVSLLPVPLLSTAMGGLETGYDMRDPSHQGTKYNGSGCLIHGSSVVADSFVAIDCLLQDRPQDAGRLLEALKNNFADAEDLRQYLLTCPKFGNNDATADLEVVTLLNQVTALLSSKKNYLGNPFRPDYSSPSTHLLYGSPLCGGRSYALLETFFRSFLTAAGYETRPVYDVLNGLASGFEALADPLRVETMFCGSRQNPSLRGSITNISTDNFTPEQLTVGFLQGCVNELYETYLQLQPLLDHHPAYLVGSGNGLRKNPVLQKLFERTFDMKLLIPRHMEEAAYGAALFAMICTMPDRDPQSIRNLIQYTA